MAVFFENDKVNCSETGLRSPEMPFALSRMRLSAPSRPRQKASGAQPRRKKIKTTSSSRQRGQAIGQAKLHTKSVITHWQPDRVIALTGAFQTTLKYARRFIRQRSVIQFRTNVTIELLLQ